MKRREPPASAGRLGALVPSQKKIPRALSPKDCTLVHLVLQRFIGYLLAPIPQQASGRSSDSRIFLLSEPSHFASAKQWRHRISSPFTAAGPFPNHTGFPFKRTVPDLV